MGRRIVSMKLSRLPGKKNPWLLCIHYSDGSRKESRHKAIRFALGEAIIRSEAAEDNEEEVTG